MTEVAQPRLTVTGALSKKITTSEKIVKLTGDFVPVSSKTKNRAPKDDPVYTAIEKFQQITDLTNYYDTLTAALVHSNAMTTMNVNGIQMSIAEVLFYKSVIVPIKGKLLTHLKQHLSYASGEVERQNILAENKLKQMLTGSEGADDASIQGTKDLFWRTHRYVLVDPLNAKKLVAELEAELKNAGKPLDLALANVNAKTRLSFESRPAPSPYKSLFNDQLSVAAAMSEKKELSESLPVMLQTIKFVSFGLENNPYKDEPALKSPEMFQKFQDGLVRLSALASAVIYSNYVTTVQVVNQTISVVHAVEMKNGWLSHKRSLLARLKSEKTRVEAEIKQNNVQCEQRIQTLLEKSSSKDNTKLDAEGMSKIEQMSWDNNRWELIDPLNVADRIEKLETQITEIQSTLDTVLS